MEEIKLDLRDIDMDMGELLKKYNYKMHSCSNGLEIIQISRFCSQNRNDYRVAVLLDMIDPKFAYAGLYPQVMRPFDILPDEMTEEQKKLNKIILEELKAKRNERKAN